MFDYQIELQMFEEFISGELSPSVLNHKINDISNNFIKEEFENCLHLNIINFTQFNERIKVIYDYTISSAHPLAKEFFKNKSSSKKKYNELRKNLNINQNNPIYSFETCCPLFNKVGIIKPCDWEGFHISRIKYCYYFQVFENSKNEIKRDIRKKHFELNTVQFKELILKIQSTLFTILKELKLEYKIYPEKLKYCVKEEYDEKDYFSLVYMTLISIINDLYEAYPKYFDKSFNAPYLTVHYNKNKIIEKIQVINKYLIDLDIDEVFKKIINDQFDVLCYYTPNHQLTYHELDYYISFVNEFYNWINENHSYQKEEINDKLFIGLLIALEYNNITFVNYLLGLFKKNLEKIKGLEEKKILIIDTITKISQVLPVLKFKYDPNALSISDILINWLNKELELIDILINEKNNNQVNFEKLLFDNSIKLKTTLKVEQFSVFIKTLQDCKVIVPNSKTELAKWINQSFQFEKNENISVEYLRNKMYSKDNYVFDVIKDISYEMINIANKNNQI